MTLPLPTAPFDPPYHACIFVDTRTPGDNGFAARAVEMVKLAKAQPGFLGLDGVRGDDGLGILVSYWRDEQSIAAWREHDPITVYRARLLRLGFTAVELDAIAAEVASPPTTWRASSLTRGASLSMKWLGARNSAPGASAAAPPAGPG